MQDIELTRKNVEIDDIDRAKMRGLAVLLVKIAKRLRAEEFLADSAKKVAQ